MKQILSILAIAAALNIAAPPASGQNQAPQPGAQPGVPGQQPIPGQTPVPGAPFTPVPPQQPGLSNPAFTAPGVTNRLGVPGAALTNRFGTNVALDNVAEILLNLQASIEDALPLIAALTSGDDFNAIIAPRTSGITSQSGVNLGTQSGVNFSARTGANLSADLSTSPGGLPPQGQPIATPAPGDTQSTLPGAAAPTPPDQLATGTVQDPDLAADSLLGMDRDSFRLLVVLQADLGRTLPVVSALTGTAPGQGFVGGAGGVGGVITNRSGTLTNRLVNPMTGQFLTPTNPPRVLAPTGR